MPKAINPKKILLTAVLAGLAYLGCGSLMYINARLSKSLIHTASYITEDGTKVPHRHGIEPGEYRLDGMILMYLLYPFIRIEVAYWYITEPVAQPISPGQN